MLNSTVRALTDNINELLPLVVNYHEVLKDLQASIRDFVAANDANCSQMTSLLSRIDTLLSSLKRGEDEPARKRPRMDDVTTSVPFSLPSPLRSTSFPTAHATRYDIPTAAAAIASSRYHSAPSLMAPDNPRLLTHFRYRRIPRLQFFRSHPRQLPNLSLTILNW
ncbi:hypothetical protein BDP27DRAFT_1426755 [Rhodocollybia butyracea]|uniref:Uncharacterized protein n=1 Tax=Rhodocollybia butyracea TaxID=206335 RepID=A0A9P5U2L6_9AGAR|nr:hypothetical protein BDP27DRAFT_1426755 [Rhodocollybia butyracea]